jgi:hypothetical protein
LNYKKILLFRTTFFRGDYHSIYDKYLSYAGFEQQTADGPDAGQASGQKNHRESLVEKRNTETPEKAPAKSSAQQAREMEAKAEKTRPDNSTKAARLIDEWEKQTGNSAEDVDKHYTQQPGNKPTWMKENLGKTEYYEKRAKDFEERNPGKKAPAYYREYGDKYVKRFDKLKPELSKEGQKWKKG